MNPDAFDAHVAARALEGRRLHARWDPELFHALAEGPARALWGALRAAPDAPRALDAYLRLVAEGIGLGLLDTPQCLALLGRAAPLATPPSLLARLLVLVAPAQLATVPPGERVAALARLWNLGEGLLAEPPWLHRYVAAALADHATLHDLDAALVRVLGPALAPAPPSSWRGPFALQVLDVAAAHEEFLPGAMHLAAPSVLCVHDRRVPALHAGVLLRRGGASALMGLTPCLGEGPSDARVPPPPVSERGVTIHGQVVPLPRLGRVHAAAMAPSGFYVAAAVDSQRLWIVESP